MKTVVNLHVQMPYEIIQRKKWYVASCPIMGVHSQGETEEQAKKNLIEAMTAFFISCFKRGTMDDVLKECGFTPFDSTEQIISTQPEDIIDVPIPFQIPSLKHTKCHV
jgi:predicted RNase H-like HicB family nuclease